MLDFEYALFTTEDPIKLLKDGGKNLSIPKKLKYDPHVRRAEALVRKSKKWRDVMIEEKNVALTEIASAFATYFGLKLDKGLLFAVPRDVTTDFVKFLDATPEKGPFANDKYKKAAVRLIFSYSDAIDAFVKAFLSIRLAQGELDKLKSN